MIFGQIFGHRNTLNQVQQTNIQTYNFHTGYLALILKMKPVGTAKEVITLVCLPRFTHIEGWWHQMANPNIADITDEREHVMIYHYCATGTF